MPTLELSRPQTVCLLLLMLLQTIAHAAGLDDSLKIVSATNLNGIESQNKIDTISVETQRLLEEYRELRESADYQAAYTRELEELDLAQQQQLTALRTQINQARVTRQRIVPLMRSMVDALEKFVVLDLPFHHELRINAVLKLKQRLSRPDLSVSSKFRLVLEAYQLEQDYGGNIEAWRGPLRFGADELSVQFLRVGRVALYYQSLDGRDSGYWDTAGQGWVALDSDVNAKLVQALRVARNQMAPQLFELPMPVPGDNL